MSITESEVGVETVYLEKQHLGDLVFFRFIRHGNIPLRLSDMDLQTIILIVH